MPRLNIECDKKTADIIHDYLRKLKPTCKCQYLRIKRIDRIDKLGKSPKGG